MIHVKWSDDLELLADQLIETCREIIHASQDPFGKICVVVNDRGTENWLRNYALLKRRVSDVIVNIRFMMLPELINHWLAALVHGIDPRDRRAGQHPYAENVMTWRIYRILNEEDMTNPDFQDLKRYIGGGQKSALRRLELSRQIAHLFDAYLNSRYKLLRNWEVAYTTGEEISFDREQPEVWQKILYQKLIEENPDSYASDYEAALQSAVNDKAFASGFPRYLSVQIFDVPFMSNPQLELLKKISEALDMRCWSFNPGGDWLGETTSKAESIKAYWRTLRNKLRNENETLCSSGIIRSQQELQLPEYADEEERLLGAMASGARALIGAQVEANLVSNEDILRGKNSAFERLKSIDVSVHSAYSARRELEAARDGLLDYFKQNPDSKPHDAVVLCADWGKYAPVIESVFPTERGAEGYISFRVAGALAGDTPIVRSFVALLEFRKSRFEVNAIASLLEVPEIGDAWGLCGENLNIARELLKEANIHWGYDDEEVNQILGVGASTKNHSFTWKRGLLRLMADMLWGQNDDEQVVELPRFGEILPVGNVESERANVLGILWKFGEELRHLREQFQVGCKKTYQAFEADVLDMMRRFYGTENNEKLMKIRESILSVGEAMQIACLADVPIDSDVYLSAIQEAISSMAPRHSAPEDSILFAPLKVSTANKYKFVWICGLNSGTFPRNEPMANFNFISHNPCLYDVTLRERDGYALLKAALSAEACLNFSYIGRDCRTNEECPQSVLLQELEDYFLRIGKLIHHYTHPLHGYSDSYFDESGKLPPTYSMTNYRIAAARGVLPQREALVTTAALRDEKTQGTPLCQYAFQLQAGTNTIPLDDLCSFYSNPNIFLLKRRLGLATSYFNVLDAANSVDANLEKSLKNDILLDASLDENEMWNEHAALVETEKGYATTKKEAQAAIQELRKEAWVRKLIIPRTDNVSVASEYLRFCKEYNEETGEVKINVDGKEVVIPYSGRFVNVQLVDGCSMPHTFYYENATSIFNATQAEYLIRHLAGHAAGLTFVTLLFCNGTNIKIVPLSQEAAMATLTKFVKIASDPLPPEYPDLEKNIPKLDDFPFEWKLIKNKLDQFKAAPERKRSK